MDKLNKTFEPQQVLEAQDMTDVVGKVNELVESVNIYDNLDALAFQAQEATTEANEAATNANREAEAAQAITVTVTEESKKIAQLNSTIEQQEASRTQQEGVREANEKTRQSQEEARQANFSSSTSKAETAAQTANEAAEHAETATQQITSGENGRVAAEQSRVAEEAKRVEAEVARVAAEEARVTAEENRVTEFDKLKQTMQSAVQSSETATQATQTATTKANEATTKATDATTKATQATTNATAATTKANEAAKLATDAASNVPNVDVLICSTPATTSAKEVAMPGFVLGSKTRLLIKMNNMADCENVTLTVNNSAGSAEAKPLMYNGRRASINNTWVAGDVLDVYYDGTNYQSSNWQGASGVTEINVSITAPKGGTNQSNKYTLSTALEKIADVPKSQQVIGFKCSFINDNLEIETAVYQGDTWGDLKSWKRGESGEITTKYNRLCWMNAHGQKLPLWPQTTLWSLEFQFAQNSNYLMLNTLDDATKMGIKIQIGYVSQAITYYLNGELKTVQLNQFESLNHTVISYDGYTLRVYYSGVLQAEDLLGSSYDFRFPEKFTALSSAPFAFLRTYNYPITEDIFRGGACRLEPLDWSRRNAEPEILSFSVKGVQPELSKITFPRNVFWQNDFITYNGNRVIMNAKGKSLTTLIAHITTTKESFIVHHLTNNPCLLIGYNNGRPLEKVSNGIKLKPGENTVISVGFSYSDYKITSDSAETEECIMYVDCITSGCVRNYDVINANKEFIYDDCMGKKYKCKSIPDRNSLASSVVYGPNQPKYPYFVGQIWINPTDQSSYICVDIMKKLWKKITS